MTKPARATLTLRGKSAPIESAPVETVAVATAEPTCYARNGTEIVFTSTAALITHDGSSGDTEEGIAATVDGLLVAGAYAQLRASATFMQQDGVSIDEPSNYFALSVDPTLLATLVAQADAVAPMDVDVVSQACAAEVAYDASKEDVAIDTPKGDEVELDLTAAEITFATTKQGAPYATLRCPGMRTTMAFGPVADALRDRRTVTCIVSAGRSTNKIVAVRGIDDDLIVELPRAA